MKRMILMLNQNKKQKRERSSLREKHSLNDIVDMFKDEGITLKDKKTLLCRL
jgi:hypothetical protein